MSIDIESWGENHGYTQRCAHCGALGDSTFCSVRCQLDELAAAREEEEDPEVLCGEYTVYGGGS